ncbi:NFACT family protein [Cohnella sp. AR92]|uniref:Rqc2 family fibronectin-binding protein n=1 Tax=Cohnella sp. AR92 TaxID=648716 RepID=UPI000F8C5C22|nr:NFACT RNA binding domain-containing protein [Cohnella sp. AR92]RUS46490.1 fibronectin/fibrinogen-binding protein [Cohnella sp. AR92]
MSLDGFVTRALTHELQALAGARIHKIYQPTENEIVLHVRGQGFGKKLLLSAHPSMPRIHVTEKSWENPQEPPMFCMLLRKHCEGGIIEEIRQDGLERVVELDIRHRDELGDLSIKRLTLEIMGRHSNLILHDPATGLIHDGIRHVTPAISSYRIVMPGTPYVAPPAQGKRNPLDAETPEQFRDAMEEASAGNASDSGKRALEQALVNAYTGISPLLAKEIVYRADGSSERLWPIFRGMMDRFREHAYFPSIVETEDGKSSFSVAELTHLEGKRTPYETANECLDSYYGDKAERDLVRQRTTDLARMLQNETAKNEKKLEKLDETLQEASGADQYRKIGELLTAHLHLIQRGDKQIEVTDYYEEEQPLLTIKLDPLLTPNENLQRYFRKYNKLKNSRSVVIEQISATQEEIRYLESVLQGLQTATPSDIEEIREELMEQGYLRFRSSRKGAKKKRNDRPFLLCYTSSEGIPIYVGKNNTQNDYVTNRLGHPNDTWLHTKDIPGSHVLIRGADYGEDTLREAALLAAYYSKAKESSSVPVDYTKIRLVRKPNGAKPGFVIYEGQKTLFVTPDEETIRGLASVVKQP